MIAKNTPSHSSRLQNVSEPVPGVAALWSLVLRQYRSILLGTAAGVLLAGVYCVLAPHVFESTTKILVIRKDSAILAMNGDSSPDATPTVEEGELANQVEMLASETVAATALAKNGIGQRASIADALGDDESPVDYVIRNLRVSKGGEGSARAAHVVSVGFRHTDAKDCRDFLSSLIESYQEYLYTTMRKPVEDALAEAIREREKFETQLEALRSEEDSLRVHVAWDRDGLMVQRANLEKLRSTFRSIQEEQIQTESRLNEVRSKRDSGEYVETDLLGVIGQRDIGRLGSLAEVQEGVREAQQQLLQYRVEWQKYTKFGADHPKKRQITAAIKEIEKSLDRIRSEEPTRLVSAYIAMLTSDLAELNGRHQVVEAQLAQEEERADSMVEMEMRQNRLANDITRCERSLDEQRRLVQKHEAASRYGGFNTEIINPVQVGKQVAPKPALLVALGTFLGMCLGVAVGVVRDQSAQTFCDDDDVSWTLGLPVLDRFCVGSRGPTMAHGKRSALDGALVTHHRPSSRESEPFHNLGSLIGQRTDLRLLQVTSVGSGDGKTTLAANLAISLAQAGKRVLLVDANLKRSRMAEMFSIPSGRGLSTLLAEEARVSDVAQQTEVDNLWLVPSGPRVAGADLMRSQFIGFLNRVYEEYDVVILDGPALTSDADSIQIASQMDGVILTVDFEKTRSGPAIQACDMLSSLNTEILGIVVDASPRSTRRAPLGETTLVNEGSHSRDKADRYFNRQRPSTRPNTNPLAGCMVS